MGHRYDDDVHVFSIVNSLLIVVFLTGMVAMILLRTLHRDLTRYNMTDEERAEEREETGWKLVHGDVFRPPNNPMLFSVTVGTGVQVFYMSIVTLVFAAIGFLSPANRGSLMIAVLLLFVLMGILGGLLRRAVLQEHEREAVAAHDAPRGVPVPRHCVYSRVCAQPD